MARDGAQVSSPGLHRRESAKVREKAGDSPSAKGRKAKAAVAGRRPKRATRIRQPVLKTEAKTCEYCGGPIEGYYRANKKYCTEKCRTEARNDNYYHGGLRRTAVGFDEGTCWVCQKTKLKSRGKQVHHVVGKDNAPEPLVVLCRGCHTLVSDLGRRLFLEDPEKLEDLITLARFAKGLPNVRTIVKFEEVE